MAKGPRYRRPFRRRTEGKTNYHKRLKLLKSRKPRLVIRASTKHITVQVIESKLGGDKVLTSGISNELKKKFDWKANTGNIPAAYLTGYLVGKRAVKNNITDAVTDLGILYHRNRVLAAFKGAIDAGMEISYNEEFFPENFEETIKGAQVESLAKSLKENDPEVYERMFSGYLKRNKVDPTKISKMFNDSLKKIENLR